MKIAIIGATGKAGKLIMEEALKRGLDVTAIVRNKSKLSNSSVKLIEKDFLHFIATDAHGIDYRTVHWNECLDYLQKKYNDDYLKWLLVDNPKKIISEQIL